MTEEIKLHTGRIVEQYAVLVKDEHDVITNLSHYQGSQGLEVIEADKNFLAEEMLRSYYKGKILKYLLHEREKNGLEDLKKARKHLDWLIELEEL
jgi:hypothetical protein